MVWYPTDMKPGDLLPPRSSRHRTWRPAPPLTLADTDTDIWWSSLEICSNLFTWGPTPHPPHWYCHLVGVTKTRVVGKRVVRILLECCLVYLLCFAARHTPRQRCVVTYEILSPRGDGLPCSAKLHSPSSSRSSSPEKRDSCTRTGKDISLPAVWSIGEYWVDDICIAKEIPLSLCISVLTDNWSTFDNFCCFKKSIVPGIKNSRDEVVIFGDIVTISMHTTLPNVMS